MVVPVQSAFVPILIEFQDLGRVHLGPGEPPHRLVLGHLDRAHGLRAAVLHLPLRNFFVTLPRDLIEAARVDGASNWKIFRSIVLPLSVPALAAFGIFQFLWVWNDLLMALVFIQEGDYLPMTVRITQLLGPTAPSGTC